MVFSNNRPGLCGGLYLKRRPEAQLSLRFSRHLVLGKLQKDAFMGYGNVKRLLERVRSDVSLRHLQRQPKLLTANKPWKAAPSALPEQAHDRH